MEILDHSTNSVRMCTISIICGAGKNICADQGHGGLMHWFNTTSVLVKVRASLSSSLSSKVTQGCYQILYERFPMNFKMQIKMDIVTHLQVFPSRTRLPVWRWPVGENQHASERDRHKWSRKTICLKHSFRLLMYKSCKFTWVWKKEETKGHLPNNNCAFGYEVYNYRISIKSFFP